MAGVLVIDDEEAVRSTMKIVLETSGFAVTAVGDGKSGIAAIQGQEFEVVIVDLFMRGMNGLETIKIIRRLKPELPIIAASGFMFGGHCPEMPEFQAMAAEAGATSVLYKPFRPDGLLKAIQRAMSIAA